MEVTRGVWGCVHSAERSNGGCSLGEELICGGLQVPPHGGQEPGLLRHPRGGGHEPQLGCFPAGWPQQATTPLSLGFLTGGVTGARGESVTGTALSAVTVPSSEVSRGGEGSTVTAPEDIHPEPGTREWMPPGEGVKAAAGIKHASQRTSRSGDWPGGPRWVQWNHESP